MTIMQRQCHSIAPTEGMLIYVLLIVAVTENLFAYRVAVPAGQAAHKQCRLREDLPLCLFPQTQMAGIFEVCCPCHQAEMFPSTRQSLPLYAT